MTDILSTDLKHERWSRLLVATIRLPDGQTTQRDIEDHGNAAVVLPYDPDRRVAIVIRQFRTPAHYAGQDGMVMEAAAGRLDEADPEACARREALEEAGVRLTKLEHVAQVWTLPALSTERAHLYLAPYVAGDRIQAGGGLPEEHEEISVIEMPLSELAAMADTGAVAELKLLALIQTLRLRHPDLFLPPC